jgi:hypothetical protein
MTQKYGGNVMDMGDDGHRIILEYDYSYVNGLAENEKTVDKAIKDLYGGTRELITKFINEGKASQSCDFDGFGAYRFPQVPRISTPIFLNDAYGTQDYWGRFKEKDFIKRIKREVDPYFFFGTRTHSWKM